MNLILGATNALRTIIGRIGQVMALKFDATKVTFTPDMAKRNSAGPFAAGIMSQGKSADATGSDRVVIAADTAINGFFYPLLDEYQGSIIFWITPEWNGNDGLDHKILHEYASGAVVLNKDASSLLSFGLAAGTVTVNVAAWVAGTTYCVVCRWDSKNTLDGTNYMCVSVNDVHAFGRTTALNPGSITNLAIGSGHSTSATSANALLEGLTILRFPLFDGSYGLDQGEGDVINLLYNAGTGKDVTELVGSWGVTFCLPTNATAGALTTGSTDAWSHPHASNALQQWHASDGYYGQPWALKGRATCGSDAALDNLSATAFTVDGWFLSEQDSAVGSNIISKASSGVNGWQVWMSSVQRLYAAVNDTPCSYKWAQASGAQNDRKWHHFAMCYDDSGDRKVYLAVDGVWQTSSAAITGTRDDDAAYTLVLGAGEKTRVGWLRVSQTWRYTPGTNFNPISLHTPPASDANTVGLWLMSEGTGTTVDNAEGTAARDGTITAGTWVRQWEDVGTPVTPTSVAFNGTSTAIDCGSEASADDLADNEFTVEVWICSIAPNSLSYTLCSKHPSGDFNSGWLCYISSSNGPGMVVRCVTTSASITLTAAQIGLLTINDGRWHHVAFYFNDAGDRKPHCAVDGIWYELGQTPGAGAIKPDADGSLFIGRRADSASWFYKGAIGWTRISNNARYTPGTNFTPPARTSPPANDANTVRLFAMNEGAGTVITDSSSNLQDGTLSNGTWNTTRDLATYAPGERVYNWGYSQGSDAADEGISQTLSDLIAGADYVIRPVLHYDRNAVPVIKVLDATNADAVIASLTCPNQQANLCVNGGFDSDTAGWTAGASATLSSDAGGVSGNCLTVTNGAASQGYAHQAIQLMPYATYRLTWWHKNGTAWGKVSVGTSAGGTTIYGGSNTNDTDWAQKTTTFVTTSTGLVYVNLWQDSATNGQNTLFDSITLTRVIDSKRLFAESMAFSLPTVAREGVASDCVSVKVQILNTATSGVIGLHQVELL